MPFLSKVILENLSRGDDYECPFARTSIALTKMLCEVLEINGEPRKCKTFATLSYEGDLVTMCYSKSSFQLSAVKLKPK